MSKGIVGLKSFNTVLKKMIIYWFLHFQVTEKQLPLSAAQSRNFKQTKRQSSWYKQY